jgi:uncharacterized phage infection (PIP) family protein YhgE
MNEEPQQQSEWRRRITESMAATTYEQLKALVEGVTGGFAEVASSFAALEGRLSQIESALNEARLGFGDEAERVRSAFAEHAKAVSERVEGVSSDLVRDLTSRTQEISAQLAALGEEISARLQELHAEQRDELSRSRSALNDAAESIVSGVQAATDKLSEDVSARADETGAVVKSSNAAIKEELDSLAARVVSFGDNHVAVTEASAAALATAIEGLRQRLDEAKELSSQESAGHIARLAELAQYVDRLTQSAGAKTVAEISESRAMLSDLITDRVEQVSAQLTDLRDGAGLEEVADMLRRALREHTEAAATRWDDLVGQLARRRGAEGRPDVDDLALVGLIRSLEQVLDDRDERFLRMLEELARAIPIRRRANFFRRAQSSLKSGGRNPPSHRHRT